MAWRFETKKRMESLLSSKNRDESTDDEDGSVSSSPERLPSAATTSPLKPSRDQAAIQESRVSISGNVSASQGPIASTPIQSKRIVSAMRLGGEKENVDRILMPPPTCRSLKRKRSRSLDEAKANDLPIQWETLGMTQVGYSEIAALVAELESFLPSPYIPIVPPLETGFSALPFPTPITSDSNLPWTRCVPYKESRLVLHTNETLDDIDEQHVAKRVRW